MTGLSIQPEYPGDLEAGFETFHLAFVAVPTSAIRLRDHRPQPGARRFTVGELRAIALDEPLPTRPTTVTASVTVTDPGGAESSAEVPVSLNNSPPQVTILSPPDRQTYPVGISTMVPLTATFDDAEHAQGALVCEWNLELVHDNHTHPEPPDPACSSSFTLLPHGELQGDIIYWIVSLTVTDPEGLSTTAVHTMIPENDCNLNGIPDDEDILNRTSPDANQNGIPDECDG